MLASVKANYREMRHMSHYEYLVLMVSIVSKVSMVFTVSMVITVSMVSILLMISMFFFPETRLSFKLWSPVLCRIFFMSCGVIWSAVVISGFQALVI